MSRRLWLIIELGLGIVALACGCTAYLACRKGTYAFDLVLQWLGIESWFAPIRHSAEPSPLPDFIVYSLPGGLWALSYILIMDALWHKGTTLSRIILTSIVPILGVGSELMQLLHLLPGTFDPVDLISYALPYLIYIAILSLTTKYNNGE